MNISALRAATQLKRFSLSSPTADKPSTGSCQKDQGPDCPQPTDSSHISISVPAYDPPPMKAVSMDFDLDTLRAKPGEAVDLNAIETGPPRGVPHKKEDAKRILDAMHEQIIDLQRKLFSENKQSVLVLVQGMDNAGKGGTYKSVFAPMSLKHEAGIERHSFGAPSKEERDHDFLWRIHNKMPSKGNIGFHDRSHYEDIVEVRVSNLAPEEEWQARHQHVKDFESLQSNMGTKIVKLFLHVSKAEQKERLEDRRATPHKQYKFSADDVARRQKWPEYMEAYGDAISRTTTEQAPWYVIPADDKDARNLMVAGILLKTLQEMDPKYPELPEDLVRLPIPD
jgi:PPK2 family polyphosphate:nucleotide phosphotransferase